MICTDGLTNCVPRTVVAAALRVGGVVDDAARALLDAALNAGGGSDNVTIAVIDDPAGSPTKPPAWDLVP